MYRRDAMEIEHKVPEHGIAVTLSQATKEVHADFAGRPHILLEMNDEHMAVGYAEMTVPAALELAIAILARMDPDVMKPEVARVCKLAQAREDQTRRRREGEQLEVDSMFTNATPDDVASKGILLMNELTGWAWGAGEHFVVQTFGDSNDELTELVLVTTHPDFAKRIHNVIAPVAEAYKKALARVAKEDDDAKSTE